MGDQKLNEINNILLEEINPTLTKLKEERSAYLEYQKIQRELDHLTKLYLAYKFMCAEETSEKNKEELVQIQEKLGELGEGIKAGLKEIEEIEAAIKELERARDEEMSYTEQKTLLHVAGKINRRIKERWGIADKAAK